MPKRMEIHVKEKGAARTAREVRKVDEATERVARSTKKASAEINRMRVSTSGLRRGLGVIRNNLLLVTFAFGGLAVAIKKGVDAYRIQFEAEQRLIAGLSNVEGATREGAQALINYAAALQKATQFGDEQIISAMAMLSTFQLAEGAIKELTPRILDMATATGQDLTAAAIQVGKAFTGQIGALSRSGVVIDQTQLKIARLGGTTSEFNFLLGEMDKNFKGLAETIGTGPLAELRKLENRLGDLSEDIGRTSLPIVVKLKSAWLDFMTGIINVGYVLKNEREIEKLMKAESLSFAEAINKLRGNTEELINAELRLIETREKGQRILAESQEIELLEYRNRLLDDGVLSAQERINLLSFELVQLAPARKAELITEHELLIKTLKINNQIKILEAQLGQRPMIAGLQIAQRLANDLSTAFLTAGDSGMTAAEAVREAWTRAIRSILSQIIANAAVFALANVLMPGAGIAAKSGGFMGALLGGVKFAQHGMNQIVTQPTIIVAGERGPERVQITPRQSQAPVPAGNTYHIYLHSPIPEDYVRNDLLPVLSRIQATG